MKERNSNFEILRMIAMFLIIAHHFSLHTNWINGTSAVVKILEVGGKLGVNLFVLISGYFLVNGKFKFKKMLMLILEVMFYSVGIWLIMVALGKSSLTLDNLLYFGTPITNRIYWFITTYLIMYLLMPLTNRIIKKLGKRQHLWLIVVLVASQSVIPFLLNGTSIGTNWLTTIGEVAGNVLWFVTLYLIAGFIRKYDIKTNKLAMFIVSEVCLTTIIMAKVLWEVNLYSMQSIVCLACAVAMFMFFKELKPRYSKFVNVISGTTMGVYLLHETHFNSVIWNEWIQPYRFVNEWWFIFYAIGIIIGIFAFCMAIDMLRKYFIEKPIFKAK